MTGCRRCRIPVGFLGPDPIVFALTCGFSDQKGEPWGLWLASVLRFKFNGGFNVALTRGFGRAVTCFLNFHVPDSPLTHPNGLQTCLTGGSPQLGASRLRWARCSRARAKLSATDTAYTTVSTCIRFFTVELLRSRTGPPLAATLRSPITS
jgi:hypothetical protein